MSLFRVQTAIDKFLVILLYIAYMRHLQQIITGIHLHTDRIKCLYNLRHIRNNGITSIGQLGKEMMLNNRINTKLYFLRIDKYKLQFCRMFLIQ